MKTMKLWRIAFMMLAAFSLASCSSDDKDMVNDTCKTLSGIALTDWPLTDCSTRTRPVHPCPESLAPYHQYSYAL